MAKGWWPAVKDFIKPNWASNGGGRGRELPVCQKKKKRHLRIFTKSPPQPRTGFMRLLGTWRLEPGRLSEEEMSRHFRTFSWVSSSAQGCLWRHQRPSRIYWLRSGEASLIGCLFWLWLWSVVTGARPSVTGWGWGRQCWLLASLIIGGYCWNFCWEQRFPSWIWI